MEELAEPAPDIRYRLTRGGSLVMPGAARCRNSPDGSTVRRRLTAAGLGLLAVLLACAEWNSPQLELAGLRRTALNDPEDLAGKVNLPLLRARLQIAMRSKLESERAGDGREPALALERTLLSSAIDEAVTCRGLAGALLAGRFGGDQHTAHDSSLLGPWKVLRTDWTHFEAIAHSADGGELVLRFTREGLAWTLDAIEPPDGGLEGLVGKPGHATAGSDQLARGTDRPHSAVAG